MADCILGKYYIRRLYKENSLKQIELAHMYKIGQDQISRIINGRRWA